MKLKHSNKLLFTAMVTCFALLIVLAKPSSAQAYEWRNRQRVVTYVSGHLTDLDVHNDDPLDGAYAHVKIVSRTRTNGTAFTRVKLKLNGVHADKGTVFGSHIHTGPCVEGDGAAAGPHFNITSHNGKEQIVSPQTEVWLDFAVKHNGRAKSRSTVNFLLPEGEAQSIVIHQMATSPDGGAGPRLACITI